MRIGVANKTIVDPVSVAKVQQAIVSTVKQSIPVH